MGSPLIYLRVNPQTRKFEQRLRNMTMIDVTRFDYANMSEILEKMSNASRGGATLLTYASTLDAFKDYFGKKGVAEVGQAAITGVISQAEMLLDNTRDSIESAFGCRCLSRYSNQENGVIGQDDLVNNVFVLNEAHYVVEVLRLHEDASAAEGEVGRIVITDLYNYAMPMIRYDTGDIGSITWANINGVEKRVIANLGGRIVDVVFDSQGKRLLPHSIGACIVSFPGIVQYQFIQIGMTSYKVKLNVGSEFTEHAEMVAQLQDMLGVEVEISVEIVDEIPVLASGKRRYILNEMSSSSFN